MASAATHRWEVRDRYGNDVYMTAERWRHTVQNRPWLAGYFDAVLTTLRRGRRKQDPVNPRKYKYYWRLDDLLPDFNHLVVVVLFGEATDSHGRVVSNNHVTTVWAVYIFGQR